MFDFIYEFSVADKLIIMTFSMIFLHIIADFLVQNNFMSTYKQKKNWDEYTKDGKYKNDYKVVLLVHSFSWAFITFFPVILYTKSITFYAIVINVNTFIHAVIDDLKCNDLGIDLATDQLLHIGQIIATIIMSYFIAL